MHTSIDNIDNIENTSHCFANNLVNLATSLINMDGMFELPARSRSIVSPFGGGEWRVARV